MANISTVHDRFVRELLADKAIAIDYFKSALPEHIAGKLDFSTMEQLSGSYVSGELEQTMSDVVYRCRRIDSEATVDISILVEHKSYPDRHTPVQIGGYLFSGYQQQIKQGSKLLSPIIPILFYHGRKKWEYWPLEKLFGDLDHDLLGFLPKFNYVYHDLAGTSDEEIKAISNQFLMASLLVLKHTFDSRWLKGNFAGMLSIGLPNSIGDLQQALLTYYFNRVDLTEEQVKEVIKELPSKIKDSIMSTYEILLKKGERNKAIAIAREMKKEGLPITQIAKFTKLSIDEIEKL